MRVQGQKLSAKQQRALLALLSEPTQAQAAAKAEVAESTLYRWLADPDFRDAYKQARRQLVDTALGLLQQACAEAVATLKSLLGSPHAPTRARAALGILDQAVKAVELSDVVEKIAELQRQMDELRKSREARGQNGMRLRYGVDPQT